MMEVPRPNLEEVGARLITLRVGPEERDARLDCFLARKLPAYSRARIQKWLRSGAATLAGRELSAAYRVRAGDLIQLALPAPQPWQLVPEPLPLAILYEDDELLVLNKPPGLTVHPGAGQRNGTLVNALVHHYPQLAQVGDLERPGLVHRLDRDTSGALVVAKTEATRLALVHLFQTRQVEKKYLALIWGLLPQEQGEITAAIGRHPTQRHKMAAGVQKGREAYTSWRQQRRWDGHFSLVELDLHTGRTHQIRVHLAALGHPVVGDKIYGGGQRRLATLPTAWQGLIPLVTRQLLHAWELSFNHPRDPERRLRIQAPLPPDFQAVLTWLDERSLA